MSGLKNSPFGKRLRGTHQENEEDGPRRNRQRVNPIFYTATPSTTKDATPESPVTSRDMYGDRFVPSRDAGDMRTTYHLMDESGPSTPSKSRIIPTESDALKEQANAIFTSILHTEVTPPSPRRAASPQRPTTSSSATTTLPPSTPTRKRIFHYTSPATSANPSTPTRRLDTPTDEAYSMSPVRAESRQLLESPRRQLRSVCKTPYRVLDAPDLADDFYLNLVDWSSTNVLGVGLGSCVYLWTAHNAAVSKLCDLAGSNDTVSSVSWVQKGTMLAIGTLSGRMHIYDANTLQVQRSYNNAHTQRIGALAWNSHVLSSGSRDRMVHHRDVREPSLRPFKRCAGHRQEVCGLKWARDGGPLASGGNDNKVCIWDLRGSKRASVAGSSGSGGVEDSGGGSGGDTPLWKFHEHTAAVKALAWDPHVSGVLATGGGTQDKHIRFWNTFNGTMLSELDTGSQVCNLIWSLTSHELVSTHGFSSTTAQNQICIWKYPTLNMVASLTGHTHRVLYLAMSPDGETIVTGAGDETLRFWNAFPKKEGGEKRETRLDYGRLIR
ncbi:WD40 repeat-like protein [Suillus clintonianus]|uniref:WD40 repeat-like protein n=1 Tax=Suillus clintonianus TaxID=1904413 RepID=UPI001B878F59|nr:WD40 repeat-like protein [Suillus clintonianus]KAG2121730.1 WD40 repeat-like protein [Suillus clintonianus]